MKRLLQSTKFVNRKLIRWKFISVFLNIIPKLEEFYVSESVDSLPNEDEKLKNFFDLSAPFCLLLKHSRNVMLQPKAVLDIPIRLATICNQVLRSRNYTNEWFETDFQRPNASVNEVNNIILKTSFGTCFPLWLHPNFNGKDWNVL